MKPPAIEGDDIEVRGAAWGVDNSTLNIVAAYTGSRLGADCSFKAFDVSGGLLRDGCADQAARVELSTV